MDIPNTGAIFTLGKSYLAENTQSYFYIKNDPVKRLISGPQQSAVICGSGRLFVWGENTYGQLGVGSNHNNNNGNDIVTKPTCVKSLKTLGLKIADISFGNGWAVILTHSSELFFTGRNIFDQSNTKVRDNFVTVTLGGEICSIIRKPFRLEEFDDCISKSEDEENLIEIMAGNEHFVAMTSLGRLIGWGSNDNHQLGTMSDSSRLPVDLITDDAVQQFTCGPQSTLILTQTGHLYLTGRLNDFVFPQLTELQQNLSANEQIVCMHISQTNEIYIVTTGGDIYRSIESLRHKSLIFQQFYDYDSEENGQIWKIQRGTSFYAVVTKANKFYTTFSESGHHLKTFREISKFKNLRTIDFAVGDQHILVHGIPRSATISGQKNMNQTFVMRSDLNGNSKALPGEKATDMQVSNDHIPGDTSDDDEDTAARNFIEINEQHSPSAKQVAKPNTPINFNGFEEDTNAPQDGKQSEPTINYKEEVKKNVAVEESNKNALINGETTDNSIDEYENAKRIKNATKTFEEEHNSVSALDNSLQPKSAGLNREQVPHLPESPTNSGSGKSIQFDEKALRNPSSSERFVRPRTPYPESSGSNSTPQTVKKTKRIDATMGTGSDGIGKPSPDFSDNLQNVRQSAQPTAVSADDNDSARVIETYQPLEEEEDEEDEQLTVEINTTTDLLDKTVINEIRFINNGIDVTENVTKKSLETIKSAESRPTTVSPIHDHHDDKEITPEKSQVAKFTDKIETKMDQAFESAETMAKKAADEVRHAVQTAGSAAVKAASNTKLAVSSALTKASDEAKEAVDTMATKLSNVMPDRSPKLSITPDKPDDEDKISNTASSSTPVKGFKTRDVCEEDERTTASVNSNRTSENLLENDLEQVYDTEKKATGVEMRKQAETSKGKVHQFFSDIKSKGKEFSCRNDKTVQIEDEPPKYTPVDEFHHAVTTNEDTNKTSKVCTIL